MIVGFAAWLHFQNSSALQCAIKFAENSQALFCMPPGIFPQSCAQAGKGPWHEIQRIAILVRLIKIERISKWSRLFWNRLSLM